MSMRILKFITLLFPVFILVSCSQEGQNISDIKQFIKKIQSPPETKPTEKSSSQTQPKTDSKTKKDLKPTSKTKAGKKTQPTSKEKTTTQFKINNNPFFAKSTLLPVNEHEKYLNKILSGGIDLKGILLQDNKKWAVLQSTDGETLVIKQGMPIGDTTAYVKEITDHSITLIIPIENEQRSIILKLQEPKISTDNKAKPTKASKALQKLPGKEPPR